MVRTDGCPPRAGINCCQDNGDGDPESQHPLTVLDCDSDDSLKWEDFFGSSVDITETVLGMYDMLAKKRIKDNKLRVSTPPSDAECVPDGRGTVSTSPCPEYSAVGKNKPSMKRNFTDSHFLMPSSGTGYKFHPAMAIDDNKRPLSTSSVSSSSSSSSSSLPRSCRDSKKLYLASIESLDDDELSEDCAGMSVSSRDHSPPDRTRANSVTASEDSQKCCSHLDLRMANSGPGTDAMDSTLSHTDRVILEIIETERTYVQDLYEIIEGYLRHISANTEKIDHQNLVDLFSNIEDIYQFNRNFLEELGQCGLDPVAVARCFVKHSYGFAIYTQYCTNFPRALSVLTELMMNSETAEIYKERQTALRHNLPLGSYLLKPVQRILRYRLLLENIVKASDKDDEGYADIKNALSVMAGIAHHINEMKKRHENAIRVQEIQSLFYGWEGQDLTTYGELVAEGAFRMYRAKALRHLFLFDRMLLIAKKKEDGILYYKTHIMCSNLMLIESIQGEPHCFHVIPFDNPRYQHTFQARNVEQKREWCLQLKRVILENYNAVIPLHARQLVMELGQSKQEDAVQMEKSSSKRQLSAPEYLERRKQERRKSESSLKAFKLRKGLKKNDLNSPKSSPSTERGRKFRSASHDANGNEKDQPVVHGRWRRASVDVVPINRINSDAASVLGGNHPLKKDISKLSITSSGHSLSGDLNRNKSQLSKMENLLKSGNLERSSSLNWKARNSLPEETTDTENEDHAERIDIQKILQYRPPPPPPRRVRTDSDEMADEEAGEYVTFYFGNSCARRDAQSERKIPRSRSRVESSYDDGYCTLSPQMFEQPLHPSSSNASFRKDSSDSSASSSKSSSSSKMDVKVANYDNLLDLWTRLGTVQLKSWEDADKDGDHKLYKDNPVIRRVQSFTGVINEKPSSLHHSPSFHDSTRSASSENTKDSDTCDFTTCTLFPIQDLKNSSPVAPSVWLKQQQDHLPEVCQKCVSLPRSFQLGQECDDNPQIGVGDNVCCSGYLDSDSNKKLHMQAETNRASHCEPRSMATSRDKPEQVNFMVDLEQYIESSSSKQSLYRFPVSRDECADNYSSCNDTPNRSMESVDSLYPDHKIYRQPLSKSYTSFRTMLSNVSSRITGMKTLPPVGLTVDDDKSLSMINSGAIRSRSDGKVSSTKFAGSMGKAYSNVLKHKQHSDSKDGIASSPLLSRAIVPIHKPGSSVIGARVAYPLESEYCLLENFIPLRKEKERNEELRPDSMLSDSSNTSSCSESEKVTTVGDFEVSAPPLQHYSVQSSTISDRCQIHSVIVHDQPSDANQHLSQKHRLWTFSPLHSNGDTVGSSVIEVRIESPSDKSDASGDSYYERTFEAIESVLVDDLFRDSAIYSDPDETDPLVDSTSCTELDEDNIRDTDLTPDTFAYSPVVACDNQQDDLSDCSFYVEDAGSQHVDRTIIDSSFYVEEDGSQNVDRTIIDRVQSLEVSTLHHEDDDEELPMEKLKSIRQRCLELQKCSQSDIQLKNEEKVGQLCSTVACILDNGKDSIPNTVNNAQDEDSKPKGKGWVKHVVNKLQGEKQS